MRSTEELVQWCQRTLPEDTRAFEALVAEYSARVYATTYRLMGNHHDADDMAQEVFIKVHQNIKHIDDPSGFHSWLYRITVNTCLDNLTKRRRRSRTVPLMPEPEAGTEEIFADQRTPTPEEAALQHELRRCIERTLARLGVGERAAIVLRDVEDRSYQEIAEILALGLSAVKMRIHRARLAFGQLLATICPDSWRRFAPDEAPAVSGRNAHARKGHGNG